MNAMKKSSVLTLLFPLAGLLLGGAPALAKPFEGSLTYEIDAEGDKQEMTFRVKGSRMAFEMPSAQGGKVILDTEKEEAFVLIPQQRMYMKAPASKFAENANRTPTGTFEITDETREILGYKTRKVTYTEGGETTILWMTGEVGSFMPLDGPLSQNVPPALAEAFPNGAMPLEMISTDSGETMTLKVVALKEESLPDSEFQIPSDYRALDMGGFSMPGMGQ